MILALEFHRYLENQEAKQIFSLLNFVIYRNCNMSKLSLLFDFGDCVKEYHKLFTCAVRGCGILSQEVIRIERRFT